MRDGLFLWLWRGYLARYWPLLIIAMVLMAIEGGSVGLFAWMMAPMFDDIFVAGRAEAIWVVGLVIMAIFMVRAVTSIGQKVLLTRISELSGARMRNDLVSHLMTLDSGFHQNHPPGMLIERVQGDVSALRTIWSSIITSLGRDLITIVSLFGVALSIDWRWTLIALLGVPLLIAPSLIVQKFVRKIAGKTRVIAADMATRLDEIFHGITPIKLNGNEAYQAARFEKLTRARVRAESRSTAGQAAMPALIDVMTGLGFVGVLYFGGSEIIAGEKTVGQFMSFFTAMSLTFEPLRRLGNMSGLWQTAAASVSRLRELLETKPQRAVPAAPRPAPTSAPEIVFDDVRLSYGDQEVLRGLSFTARAGERTAIVGPSGAGKSTVFNLLTRLVDPASGRVLIGGVEAQEMTLADLRGLYSVVTQDSALFDETLRENILLGREDVSEAALSRALEASSVAQFLPQLAQGLDTPVGPRGSALSGGQRQRVAIARAVLRDRPVLLLDEATSALDTRSEAMVQDALDRLSEGRTTLVIAHRLSTILSADKIIVMDQGRVIEEGTHEQLIARGGAYAGLHALQFRAGS